MRGCGSQEGRKEGGKRSQNREIIIPCSRRKEPKEGSPTNATNHFTPFMQTNEGTPLGPGNGESRNRRPLRYSLPLFLAASPIEMTSRALFAPSSVRSPSFYCTAVAALAHLGSVMKQARCSHLFRIAEWADVSSPSECRMQNANFGCSSCNSLHFQIFDSFTLEFNSLHLPPPNPRLIETSSSPPPLDGTRN